MFIKKLFTKNKTPSLDDMKSNLSEQYIDIRDLKVISKTSNSVCFTFDKTKEEVVASDFPRHRIESLVNDKKEFLKLPPNPLLQSSPGLGDSKDIYGSNSFVHGAVLSYNQHHHLILRPDDIWFAIMNQFSNYVILHSEELRSKFVEHQGKKELVVETAGTLRTASYELLTKMMSDQIAENIKDPSVRDWVIPSFSTSTPTDKIVGIISLMSTFKNYFSYKYELCCGLPKVTLLGTEDDWKSIKTKAQRLLEFDCSDKFMSKWLVMLNKVLDNFILSSQGKPNAEFWATIAHHFGGGSGPTWVSGWITVFSVFNDVGAWIGDTKTVSHWSEGKSSTQWIFVNLNEVTKGFLSTPIVINDNGTIYKSDIYAGHMSIDIVQETGIQPRLDWALILKE